MINSWLLTVEDNVMIELFVTANLPMVWVGTPVTVRVRPELNWIISVDVGVVLVGDQLVLVTQEPLLAPIQV
jgi:hypothetical protein